MAANERKWKGALGFKKGGLELTNLRGKTGRGKAKKAVGGSSPLPEEILVNQDKSMHMLKIEPVFRVAEGFQLRLSICLSLFPFILLGPFLLALTKGNFNLIPPGIRLRPRQGSA